MFDTGEPAPCDDLFDLARIIELRLNPLVPALPVGNRKMTRDWMIRCHLDHRARDRGGGQRVVRRRLYDRVRSCDRVADHGTHAHDRHIAGDYVNRASAYRADAQFGARITSTGLLDPAFEIIDAHHTLGDVAH